MPKSNPRFFLTIFTLLIFAFPLISYASTISINSDKTLNINGVKTFPVGMFAICNYIFDAQYGETCSQSIQKNHNFTFSMSGITSQIGSANWNNFISDMENGGMYWQSNSNWDSNPSWKNVPMSDVGKPHFFGWLLQDEPDLNGVLQSTMQSHYDGIKIKDPNHPVIQNISGMNTYYFSNLKTWQTSADVVSWDTYTFWPTSDWTRANSIYAWEQWSYDSAFDNFTNVNEVTKPVWAALQGNGTNIYYLMTAPEVRALTYTAITMDVKGIAYWGYKSYHNGSSPGLVNNDAEFAIYDKVAQELRSLNDILVLPTKSFKWGLYTSSSDVTFSKTLIEHVLWKDRTNFNYILKQSGSKYYLIVVNKDANPITTDVTVAGLSGTITAKTLGLQTTGSSKSGRTLTVANGKFTDTFDGYAAHIYEISSGASSSPVPLPSSSPSPSTPPSPTPTSVTPIPTPPCVPNKTCADYPLQCWPNLFNGCSYTLDCSGTCVSPQVCNTSVGFCVAPTPAPYFIPTSVKTETISPPLSHTAWTDLISSATSWILGIISSITLLFLIIGGLFYIGSAGSEERMVLGKRIIVAALVGLIVVILSVSIIVELKKIL